MARVVVYSGSYIGGYGCGGGGGSSSSCDGGGDGGGCGGGGCGGGGGGDGSDAGGCDGGGVVTAIVNKWYSKIKVNQSIYIHSHTVVMQSVVTRV